MDPDPNERPPLAPTPDDPTPPQQETGPEECPHLADLKYPQNHPKKRLPTSWKLKVAAKALELKSEGNAGYLAKTVRLIWPDTREFSPAAFYRLRNRAGREDYRREKETV